MERHIGVWHKDRECGKEDVGELIVDGNSVEFYSRHGSQPFTCAFFGHVEYKVIVNCSAESSVHRSLDNASCHYVVCALQQNEPFPDGTGINGISEVLFEIPELINWLGVRTVDLHQTQEGFVANEVFPDLVICQANPRIDIICMSKTQDNTFYDQDPCSIKVENRPMIRVQYATAVNYETVVDDIRCITQFFGLLIGFVSGISNVLLRFENQNYTTRLFINQDFSYNYFRYRPTDRPRTYCYLFETTIEETYNNWRSFYSDEKYQFIRRMYFSANGKRALLVEDLFIQYIRILEGYHLRICGDEATAERIANSQKLSNAIRGLIYTEEGKRILSNALNEVAPNYKYNGAHATQISKWIADGYIERINLQARLKELSSSHYRIIELNAKDIEQIGAEDCKLSKEAEEKVEEIYRKHLVDTRNFYSHYKENKAGVLSHHQIADSNNVLKALILAVFYEKMGINHDLIRRVLIWDDELHFQTLFLRKRGEQPFLTPSAYYRSLFEDEKQLNERQSILRKKKGRVLYRVYSRILRFRMKSSRYKDKL